MVFDLGLADIKVLSSHSNYYGFESELAVRFSKDSSKNVSSTSDELNLRET